MIVGSVDADYITSKTYKTHGVGDAWVEYSTAKLYPGEC